MLILDMGVKVRRAQRIPPTNSLVPVRVLSPFSAHNSLNLSPRNALIPARPIVLKSGIKRISDSMEYDMARFASLVEPNRSGIPKKFMIAKIKNISPDILNSFFLSMVFLFCLTFIPVSNEPSAVFARAFLNFHQARAMVESLFSSSIQRYLLYHPI